MRCIRPETLLLSLLLAAAPLAAQQPDDLEDEGIALLRANPVWRVVEKSGGQRYEATWTLRPDGKTFDGHWVHYPGGDSGDLRAFARITTLRGSSVVVDRPGLGRYTGTLSADRTRIAGRMSWASGTWEVRLDPSTLPGAAAPAPKPTPKPAAKPTPKPAPADPLTPTSTLPPGDWQVVEQVGGTRYDAEWSLRSDGRSFDAVWLQTPGGATGRLTNFARIVAISGDQIRLERPGLGVYTGTISPDRRSIRGAMSWASGTWTVTLRHAPLPATLP